MPLDRTAGDAGAADRDRRLLLAHDDRGDCRGVGRSRAPGGHRAGDGGAGRSRDPGALFACRCSWRGSFSAPAKGVARRFWCGSPGKWVARSPLACSSVCSFALYLRYIGREVTLVLLAVCVVLSQVGTTQQLEPLLAALAAGFVIENLAVAQGDALRAAVQRGAPPVLVVFFVAIGTSLRLDAVATFGVIALALSAVRIGIHQAGRGGGRQAVRPAGADRDVRLDRPDVAGRNHPGASRRSSRRSFPVGATSCSSCVVASIAIHELVGPMLFRHGLARAGELDAQRRSSAGGRLQPRAVPAQPWMMAASSCKAGHGRRGSGAGCADARTQRSLDCSRSRRRRIVSSSMPATRCAVPPRTRRTRCAGCGSRSRPSPRTTAALRTRASGRCATSSTCGRRSGPRIGRPTRTSTRGSRPPSHAELGASDPPVFIQDYHLALVAPALRALRADARTALFWHIPWPHPDRLRICPWRREILSGLLANDLIAFQLERDRRNFLLAAEEELRGGGRARGVACSLRRPAQHGHLGADWGRLRSHPEHGRRSGAAGGAAAPA